jgi:hypothetical protein
MRLLTILAVVLVFGALMMFDTAALLRLTWYCATGGCGVRPEWIGLGAGVLVLVLVLAHLGSGAAAKVVKSGRKPPAARKSPVQQKSKRTKKPA